MIPELSPTLVRRRLTSLFPAELIEGIAHERDAVQRYRKIDITMLVWSLILGFAGGGETRSIAAFQRTYQTATNQTVVRSSFYDRLTPELRDLLKLNYCIRIPRLILTKLGHQNPEFMIG